MSTINILVEGITDEAVAIKLVAHAGYTYGTVYGKQGWEYIKDNVAKYNQATRFTPYLALVDFMDTGFLCPGEAVTTWLPEKQPNMLLRAVVREIESWLLADRQNFARFLHVSIEYLPAEPERVDDPKAEVIRIARRSKNKKVRQALIPGANSTAQVGPLYATEMIRFIQNEWDIEAACQNAPSLVRCIERLKEIDIVNTGDLT